MTDEEFRKAIVEALHEGPPFATYDLLVRYRDSGGQQARAYEILKGILLEWRDAGIEEELDDELLDTMEAVIGDIAPSYRLWPNRLKT